VNWRDIPFHPPSRTLRVFGGGLAILLVGLAIWRFAVEDAVAAAAVLGAAAAAVAALAWAFPALLRPVFVTWMIAVFPINWLLTRVLLACIFYLMVTPLALVFRLMGRDILERRFRPDQESYWSDKPTREDVDSYLRPF
jgi:hypothetical protein